MTHATYLRLHVRASASNREVIAKARQLLTPHGRREPSLRPVRHELYRAMLSYHQQAYRTMCAAMCGSFE